jgi:2-methylisocitrate lyase-like PEP mutase family enzyme
MTEPTYAEAFRRLHQDGLLILPNAWDAASARLVESLGAKAIATTSAGLAWAQGYPDGNRMPVPALRAAVSAIVRVIRIPLTVDAEAGYSDDPAAAAETVASLMRAGAVGINLEDGDGTPAQFCAKVERIKRAVGDGVFVNARTDVYLHGLAPQDKRVEETLARGRQYRDAGADGLFVPGVSDRDEIRAIAGGAGLPLNVMAWPGLPDAAGLLALGARRLSAGSGVASSVYGRARALAAAFLVSGSSEPFGDGAIPYPEMQALFDDRS